MSGIPSDEAVKTYVGSWGEWMDSVGVSWDDADPDFDTYLDCPCYLEEEDTCVENDCHHKDCPMNPSSQLNRKTKEEE